MFFLFGVGDMDIVCWKDGDVYFLGLGEVFLVEWEGEGYFLEGEVGCGILLVCLCGCRVLLIFDMGEGECRWVMGVGDWFFCELVSIVFVCWLLKLGLFILFVVGDNGEIGGLVL